MLLIPSHYTIVCEGVITSLKIVDSVIHDKTTVSVIIIEFEMMDARKLLLRFLVVYQGVHLVRSIQDPDAVSQPDKLCLPYGKSELERYLKEHDTPEVSMSNRGSSLSVKDTESLPFGVLSVDWRRLRLLSDLSTLPKPGIDKISSDKDFTEEVEENEAFLTTGNIRVPVPDERRGTTAHVRLHRSTFNNRNGDIDSTVMTVEPADTSERWEGVTESQTGIDLEEDSGLTTGIPMLEDVEETEMITTDNNSNTTTKMLTTTFKNTESMIEQLGTTEEIRQTISVPRQNSEEKSSHHQESSTEVLFPSTTEEKESKHRQESSSEVFPSTTEQKKSTHRQEPEVFSSTTEDKKLTRRQEPEVFPLTTEDKEPKHRQEPEVFSSTTEDKKSKHRQESSSEAFPLTTEDKESTDRQKPSSEVFSSTTEDKKSKHRQESSSEAFPLTTEDKESTDRQKPSSEVLFPSTTEEKESTHHQKPSSEVFPSTTEEEESIHFRESEVFPSTTEEDATHRQDTVSEVFPSTTEEAEKSPSETDIGTTKMTVILKIGEPFSSVPKFVEHYGDRESNENRVWRVRNFGKSWDRHSQKRIDPNDDEVLAKTRQSVFEPFDLGKKLRTRRPNSRDGKEGLVKRGGHNTNTEKLFRWFYRGDRNHNSGEKTEAEIKCTERSRS